MTSTGTRGGSPGGRWRSPSLATRIFLVSSLLVALAVGAAVTVTSVLASRIAGRAAEDALESSSTVQTAFEGQRYERLRLLSHLFAADPSFAAYVAEAAGQRDARSILDLLVERRKDLGYDFAMVLDPTGRVIARTDRPQAAGDDLSKRPLVARALQSDTGYEAAGVWKEASGDLYYSVAVPISKDTLIGYLVTGFAINDASAYEVHKLSGADVAFVTTVDRQPAIVASNLDRETAASLTATLRSQAPMMDRVMGQGESVPRRELAVRGEPWIALIAPLKDAAGKTVAATVALASLTKQLAPYRQIQNALLASGLFSVLLAFVLSYVFARQSLAPVRRLAGAAEAARQGDYDQTIAVDRSDEVGRLGRAFDELLSDLREKRDMETYLTELSRNLPEPAQARAYVGAAQSRDALLLGLELRGFGRPDAAGAGEALERLSAEWKRLAAAVAAGRGQVEAVFGQRLVARFEGEGRALRALAVAAAAMRAGGEAGAADGGAEAPLVAMAAGRLTVGPVTWSEQPERTVLGLPLQQLEGLGREATAGEIVVSRNVYEELKPSLEQAGYYLAPRRAVVSPQPLYVLSGAMAARTVEVAGAGSVGLRGAPAGKSAVAGAATLSGIEPGALMAHRFEILAVLGSCGMGVVYKARDRELDDLVALKMLKRDLWGDRGQLERLKSELKLARKITHPNVLRTYDFGEVDGIPFISMEYVRGVTLRFLLDQTHRLPYSAGLRLAKQLCAGLGVAHAAGVLHRDIKPENLILEPTGNAKLMDFGIARPLARAGAGQTQAGFVVGTPQYLSPEQLQGREPDVRADIYSCGVVFYEVFTGKLPFAAPTDVELLMKSLKEPPPPPAEHWPEIPPRLEDIILRCLRKEPDERYANVDDLHRDLDELSA